MTEFRQNASKRGVFLLRKTHRFQDTTGFLKLVVKLKQHMINKEKGRPSKADRLQTMRNLLRKERNHE